MTLRSGSMVTGCGLSALPIGPDDHRRSWPELRCDPRALSDWLPEPKADPGHRCRAPTVDRDTPFGVVDRDAEIGLHGDGVERSPWGAGDHRRPERSAARIGRLGLCPSDARPARRSGLGGSRKSAVKPALTIVGRP